PRRRTECGRGPQTRRPCTPGGPAEGVLPPDCRALVRWSLNAGTATIDDVRAIAERPPNIPTYRAQTPTRFQMDSSNQEGRGDCSRPAPAFRKSPMNEKRQRLTDILRNPGQEKIKKAFSDAKAADDFTPLPGGQYIARIIDGVLTTAKKGTPGFKLT